MSRELFENLAFDFVVTTAKTKRWSEKHHKDTLATVKRYLIPAFNKRLIASVTAPELVQVVKNIESQNKLHTAH
ncbi:MAG: hypothetical protein Q4B71_02470 [Cardiobacteriaceae bacterium]|nr:hypothetical protein [Cardiobacteriaceae bacterium]